MSRRQRITIGCAVILLAGASAAQADERLLPITARVIPIEVSSQSLDGAVTDIGPEGRDFRLSSDVLFDFDKANLKPRALKEIARIAKLLTAQAGGPNPVVRIDVTGHTDSDGSDAYNVELSQRRARAVQIGLQKAVGAGITVTAAGKGETEPIASNATNSGRAKNRRVEIIAA